MDCEEGVCAVPKKVTFGENLTKEFDKNEPAAAVGAAKEVVGGEDASDPKKDSESSISWMYVIILVIVLIIVILVIGSSKSDKPVAVPASAKV